MTQLQLDLAAVCPRGMCTPVLHDIHLTLTAGQLTAVLGRNGAGKSTLLGAIAGRLPFSGEITCDGQSVSAMSAAARARMLGCMQQSLTAPHITVETLIGFGRKPYLSLSDRMTDADWDAVEHAITAAALPALRHRYLDELSGGELRRAYLGMILAQKAPILLLDEATANMDMDYEASFLSLLSDLAHSGNRCVVSVMHNLTAACRYADMLAVIDGGRVVFFGTPDAFCLGGIPEKVFHARCVRVGETVFFETERELRSARSCGHAAGRRSGHRY